MMLEKLSSKMCWPFLLQSCLIIIYITHTISVQPPLMPEIKNLDKISLKGKPVSPCIACRTLVKSFLSAVTKTSRESFAGGDTHWEEQKLGAYENSELRLIEIQEILCADAEYGKDQCYNLAEQYESELEDWFYEKRKKNIDLYDSLCISHIKVCCPNNTYGPNCIPCPGGIEKPCGGHGRCKNGGTRQEPSECLCDAGYIGDLCDKCKMGYFEESNTPPLSCKPCDKACKDHCRGPGPINCEICASGFHFTPDDGCIEIEDADESQVPESELTSTDSNNTSLHAESKSNEGDLHLKHNLEDSTSNEHSEL